MLFWRLVRYKEELIINLEKKKYWIWLSLIQGLGSKKKQLLLDLYKEPEAIYQLSEKELAKIKGVGEKTIKNILDENIKNSVKKHIDYMQKNEIDIISICDDEYPIILKEIYDAPISLYIKGDKNILNKNSIAIIGCREATEYGKKVAKYFAYNLAKQGINIISGLARGIDSYAHIGANCAQNSYESGKTIAVVGNGLDRVYPKENELLVNKIIESRRSNNI